jgi:CRISPR-associated endoribonuclease Cas6
VENQAVFSVVFVLCAKESTALPALGGYLSQSSFLSLIGQFNEDMARRLHDEPNYRPYTVSPIKGGSISGNSILLSKGQPCYLRVTLLDSGFLWNALQAYVRKAGPISMRLGRADFELSEVLISPAIDQSIWAGSTDWQTLASLSARSIVTMHFISATAFSLGGHQFCLFPEPRLVWESLLRVWNRYTPTSMSIEKEVIRESFKNQITVVACALRHTYLHFPKFVQKGFAGWCTYRLNQESPLAAQLTSLAAFAPYSGLGCRTTMGMGQVRVEFDEAAQD